MSNYKTSTFVLAAAATAVAAFDSCLSTVSWDNDRRVDLFGLAPDASIWHKFYTGWDWQPSTSFERIPSVAGSCPSVSSWGEGRLDIVYVNDTGANVLHKYFDGGWGPSWEGAEDLGGDVEGGGLASVSWDKNRLDIVAKSYSGSYIHKAWTGNSWYPPTEWEDLGGNFFSDPVVVSWGPGRLDIVAYGAYTGSLWHRYYDDGWSSWEDLEGGPFIGNPVATSWGPGRLDFWAIDSNGELNHRYWDGSKYQGWEKLGGEFSDTPKVVHWNVSKIDIVGKGQDDETFHSKSFDGSEWHPPGRDWYDLTGPFDSEPGLVAKHSTNFLYIFGINKTHDLGMQIWTGHEWQPGHNKTWSLGNVADPYSKVDGFVQNKDQSYLGPSEL